MASLAGGPSDKLGNEYERLWVVRQLVGLLSGRAISVRIEPVGDEERGTEFWVSRPDGTREAHQAKRENGSDGKWSVWDLQSRGILRNAKFQLERSAQNNFYFVSGDKAGSLADLSERARRGDSDHDFVTVTVRTSSKLSSEFDSLCKHLAIDPADPSQVPIVRDFLRRFHVRVVDKDAIRHEVEDFVSAWVSGDPVEVVVALEAFASRNESMGRVLRECDLVAALPSGSKPLDLAKDVTLPSKIKDLNRRFEWSYRHLLIGGKALNRPETAALYSRLVSIDGPRLTLMHGAGGDGKSGIAFELERQLTDSGVPHLALRLDHDRPANTAGQYGAMLDLPGSPVPCLAAMADGQTGVLLLDQLDAIRWTSVHSAPAWDTCERLIAEALRYANLRVLVVCRTFDVEDDPRIRRWKQREVVNEFRIGPLEDGAVDAVLRECGSDPSLLGETQRRVLRSPQALYLWHQLYEVHGRAIGFRTVTDLMKMFWQMVRQKLGELKPGQYENAISALVEHMDAQGTPYSPASVVAAWPDEVKALASLNVITSAGARYLFSHQSYLDYLTAERVLRAIHAGTTTVSQWLEIGAQSLLRRGQLRQLLTLLRDEDPEKYHEVLADLLTAPGVRFHLQHLALQVLGHANPPTQTEASLVCELMKEPRWADHVFWQVLSGREAWFDCLYTSGVLSRWLTGNSTDANRAVQLLASVLATRSSGVESLIGEGQGAEWHRRLEFVLARAKADQLTEGLFAPYCKLVSDGSSIASWIDWKQLADAAPARCIRLVRARMQHLFRDVRALLAGIESKEAHEWRTSEVTNALCRVAQAVPEQTWDLLVPCLLRTKALVRRSRHVVREGGHSHSSFEATRRLRRLTIVNCRMLRAAGGTMARENPTVLRDRIRDLQQQDLGYNPLHHVVAHSLAMGPDQWADTALEWLLADRRHYRCGTRRRGAHYGGGVYRPARRLLRRFSPLCSDEKLQRISEAIVKHRPVQELQDFRFCHELSGSGAIHPRLLFLGQYLLLSSLPASRLSSDLRDWLGVLRRKFGRVGPLLRGPRMSSSGFVTSTIPQDKLQLISDRQWLDIVQRDWTPHAYRRRQLAAGMLGAIRPETFARDLGALCRNEPQRFASLAMKMPVDLDSHYLHELLHAWAETKPPAGTPEWADWIPATSEQIEAVLLRFRDRLMETQTALAFCSLMDQRGEEPWTDESYRLLREMARSHPNPGRDQYTVFRSDAGGDPGRNADLLGTALNCVRGRAAGAIEHALFSHLDKLDLFSEAVASLVQDTHPAVRAASTGLAIPLLNGNRKLAVQLFVKATDHSNDQILTSPHVDRFLSYALLDWLTDLLPLLRRMLRSPLGKVAGKGAQWVTLVWLHARRLEELVESCRHGSTAHRQGVAEVLVTEIMAGRGDQRSVELLSHFMDDPDKAVRDAAAGVVHNPQILQGPLGLRLVAAFVGSRALNDRMEVLLWGLKDLTVPLLPYAEAILGLVAHVVAIAKSDPAAATWGFGAEQLAEVLLRLYEQSDRNPTLRGKCLDAWDQLLANRIGLNLLRGIDGSAP